MLTVEEAQDQILRQFRQIESEDVPLPDALGRTLAADAVAHESLPAFANSAMDGYAVRSADLADASPERPRTLRLIGESAAGRRFEGMVEPGTAVRILTGAPVPEGADTVLQQELTRPAGEMIDMHAASPVGNNIRFPGEDVKSGDVLAEMGSEIGPSEIALFAALGVHPVRVTRRPRVAILATGDELARLGTTPEPGQIRESNSPYLAAAVARAGAEPIVLGIARDVEDDVRAKLAAANGMDLLLTSGGVSVGDYDLVKQILSEQGDVAFWRVRMKPGKPVAFGRLGDTPLLGLPGNPVSAAVTFELFGRPAIRTMLGSKHVFRPKIEVAVDGEPIARGDRRQYVRARLFARGGMLSARPTGAQGSHIISSLRGAAVLLIIPEGDGTIGRGEHVQALVLGDGIPTMES